MVTIPDIFFGFDPGGQHRFGVALLQGDDVRASTHSSIGEALSWACAACEGTRPVAAGIDTLLHWGTENSGLRSADKWLRDRYPEARSSVMCPNSLYGAMTIGGMGLALELRGRWPTMRLNETHPKVFYYAMAGKRYEPKNWRSAARWFARRSDLSLTDIDNDHEFDAVLSAWATREGYANHWQDLAKRDANLIFPAGEVNYLWQPSQS
jgi:hypothetical protein